MARQLWLLRHAEAEPHGTRPDSERRLTPRGEQQAPLAGGFDAAQAIDALAGVPAQDGRVLVVGHEPDLSLTVGGLTGGRIDLKKGGLAVVRLEGAGGELALLMRPRELALIAGVPIDRD
jgi:phosphohistidine phosphatase